MIKYILKPIFWLFATISLLGVSILLILAVISFNLIYLLYDFPSWLKSKRQSMSKNSDGKIFWKNTLKNPSFWMASVRN